MDPSQLLTRKEQKVVVMRLFDKMSWRTIKRRLGHANHSAAQARFRNAMRKIEAEKKFLDDAGFDSTIIDDRIARLQAA